jgi:hypothetical protein
MKIENGGGKVYELGEIEQQELDAMFGKREAKENGDQQSRTLKSVCPDLTKKQRQDESDLNKEAVKRNMQGSEEDGEKNWFGPMQARQGAKRLVKRFAEREKKRQEQ